MPRAHSIELSRLVSLLLVLLSTAGSPPASAGLPVQLTQNGGYSPSVSPDGMWVAYRSANGLFRIPASGGAPELLLDLARNPNWSRTNADLIAILGDGEVDLLSVSTREVTPLAVSDQLDGPPRWSPVGNELAVEARDSGDGIVFVSYPAGAVTGPLDCQDPIDGGCDGQGPTWAPDGSELAFEDGLQILRVSRAGGQASVVVDLGIDVSGPAWSPDGGWIAFAGETEGFLHIWVARSSLENGDAMQITSGEFDDAQPAWSPDSRTLYFWSDRTGSAEIWQMDIDLVPVAPSTWSGIKSRGFSAARPR